ncbi:stage VI sporulation protein D [Metabacillus bambusae]|uniref:Stage VI sporulation protein D n=1 Tax=Metabacillus bambusae TaxID=2795218 RepID=A0ABS3N953_9BACI|nr:stage VI sporulation protein D [Metabacillus bambusae]MBO1514743.1 stage VI sporulation protein D [Metabacillus bambusae]
MSQEQQQLRFSVEESVWFQKGQEVSELLTISLDPDISIHEHDQYISIRGALQLTGEYKIDTEANVQDQFEYANVRYVNEISTREDGVSIINHRFPVDITIPRNRIQDLDEVYVSIESFDYELPELKCLKLVADLSISGISKEETEPTAADVSERPEEIEEEVFEPLYRGQQSQPFANKDDTFTSFEQSGAHPFSSYYQESDTVEEDVDKLSPVKTEAPSREVEKVSEEEKEVEVVSTPVLEEIDEVDSENQEVQEDQQDQQEDLYDPFVVEVRKQEEEPVEPQEVQYSFFSKSESLANVNNKAEAEEENEREENDPKDAHYLTSLFARDEEEDFSKLKMCIVQQGDTIELISERYEISVQQLLRVNEFHADQDVYEGQILYIPAYSTSK